jgi:hypothetical protein
LRAYAQAKGWRVAGEYVDRASAVSAKLLLTKQGRKWSGETVRGILANSIYDKVIA